MVGDGEGEMDGVDAGSEGLETEDKEQEVVKVSKGELDGKAAVVTMREGEGEGEGATFLLERPLHKTDLL